MAPEAELLAPEDVTVSINAEAIDGVFSSEVIDQAFEDENLHEVITSPEHPEFTDALLEDIKSAEESESPCTGHTQYSKWSRS
jgi:hypothetical protein